MIFLHSAQDPLDLVSRELIPKATATLVIIASVSSRAICLVSGATGSLGLLWEGPEWLRGLTPHVTRGPRREQVSISLVKTGAQGTLLDPEGLWEYQGS